jgi:ATP:corrinoid adenosyltransferase
MQELRNTKAPNLLVAPVDYNKQYQDQLNNALRLYFVQIDNVSQVLAERTASNTVLIWMDM